MERNDYKKIWFLITNLQKKLILYPVFWSLPIGVAILAHLTIIFAHIRSILSWPSLEIKV
jgi:hypothetical protein